MVLKLIPVNFERLEKIPYCINYKDERTSSVGHFAFDEDLFKMGLGFWSISDVYSSVDGFYDWARKQGFCYHSRTEGLTLYKKWPV